MFRLIVMFVFSACCFSCLKEQTESSLDLLCMSGKLDELKINADIKEVNNGIIKIVLSKPYKTVDDSQQKLLLDFLISSCADVEEGKKNDINFIVALDKELGKYENEFSYNRLDVLKLKEERKNNVLQEIHEYILKEFDKKDMIVINNFIVGFYNNYPYKEDIYNVDFLELIKFFEKERKNSDKAKLTFLLLYGSSKISNSRDLENIPKHLKTIWSMVIKSDIDVVLSENFD